MFSGTPLTKGQSRDIWTWELYRTQVPVTCGDKEGMLYRAKLAKGERDWMNKQCVASFTTHILREVL